MAGITTHILDTNFGRPIAGVRIDFSRKEGEAWKLVKTVATNADGRTDGPVLKGDDAAVGEYELVFRISEVFRAKATAGDPPAFIDDPVVRFSIFDVKQHYHVPMLCAPGSFTTYRGS